MTFVDKQSIQDENARDGSRAQSSIQLFSDQRSSVQRFTDQRAPTEVQLQQQMMLKQRGVESFLDLRPNQKQASLVNQQLRDANRTGLPDNLKSGIENLSGYTMDDVRVHYNSARPTQLNAYAYAKGTDIYIGPGQEKHLAHEAWHVVQQKQGRVRPTMQMKAGTLINDDAGLEHEADVMGEKALALGIAQRRTLIDSNGVQGGIIQRATEVEYTTQSVQYTDATGATKTANVGKVADAFIDVRDPISGSAPDRQQIEMYDRLKTIYEQTFVRGHLFNDHLGGIGEVYNLFPITYSANSEHKITAEGNLKKHVRGEYSSIQGSHTTPTFIRYRVEAIPKQPADITNDASAIFRCLMVSRHNGLPDGKNHEWIIYSDPGKKVSAFGERSSKDDYSNTNLGAFSANDKGEAASTLSSRIRSKVNGWKGNQHGSFLVDGSFDQFVDLSNAKTEYLKIIDDYLFQNPIFEGHIDDFYDKSKDLLMDVHSPVTLHSQFEHIKSEILKFELEAEKQNFLDYLSNGLTNTAIPEHAKKDIYHEASQVIRNVLDLTSFHQAMAEFPDWINGKINQISQQDNT